MFVAPAFAQELETEAVPETATDAETSVGAAEAGVETQAEKTAETMTEIAVDQQPAPSFPPFDSSTFASQILWLAITFGLFYLFLRRVVLPRIGGILEARGDRIAADLDEAARLKGEADAALAAYEQELADARGKANTIGQEARDSAKAQAEAERQQVEAALETKLSEAEARIALIKDAAMRDVGTIAEETAATIVRELIGAGAGKAEVSAAVAAAKE